MAAQPLPSADPAAWPVLGLRERKKQRTRDALVSAAHRLFLSQGYGRTTVDEIAGEVDVSQRTFFRYFSSKEEVALAVLTDAEDHFVALLRERPASENPLQALRSSIVLAWRDLSDTGSDTGVTAALELIQLIEETPVLLAAHLRRITEQERLIAELIARREGLDPTVDLRPRVLAAVFGGVLRSAHLAWSSDHSAPGPEGMIAVIESHFDQLGPALAADWR
ncbi:TetR family transcriptional regulator [Kitasatospora sp. CMC57]|uniref:TetR family transcriptional regulator n=1 Tax=Kitasatospora sp. CMC57 TaxID=3231513 RepID=A0AB33K6S4_9ACTN